MAASPSSGHVRRGLLLGDEVAIGLVLVCRPGVPHGPGDCGPLLLSHRHLRDRAVGELDHVQSVQQGADRGPVGTGSAIVHVLADRQFRRDASTCGTIASSVHAMSSVGRRPEHEHRARAGLRTPRPPTPATSTYRFPTVPCITTSSPASTSRSIGMQAGLAVPQPRRLPQLDQRSRHPPSVIEPDHRVRGGDHVRIVRRGDDRRPSRRRSQHRLHHLFRAGIVERCRWARRPAPAAFRPTSAQASARRCCSPPLIRPAGRSTKPSMPTSSIASGDVVDRAAARCRTAIRRFSSAGAARRADCRSAEAGSWRSRRPPHRPPLAAPEQRQLLLGDAARFPHVGRSRHPRIDSSVDFPDPLGPAIATQLALVDLERDRRRGPTTSAPRTWKRRPTSSQ